MPSNCDATTTSPQEDHKNERYELLALCYYDLQEATGCKKDTIVIARCINAPLSGLSVCRVELVSFLNNLSR